METFELDIITPERQAFSEKVSAVYAPTENGTIGVLAHHMPLFTLLTEGEIKIIAPGKEYFLAIGGGYMQVDKDTVSILVTRAVHADEINEAEIEKARKAAREAIDRQVTGEELERAQAILRRSILEMKVLSRRRQRTSSPISH